MQSLAPLKNLFRTEKQPKSDDDTQRSRFWFTLGRESRSQMNSPVAGTAATMAGSISLCSRLSSEIPNTPQASSEILARKRSSSAPLRVRRSRSAFSSRSDLCPRELSSPWALAFVVVRFDLEAGQVVEKVVPEGSLTKEQEKEVCMMAFPDGNSHIVFDTCYVVKPRRAGSKSKFNYGYVYFRQKKDSSVARGYVQHSLVLLSRWPFASLLEPVVKQVAERYFSLCPISPTPVGSRSTTTSTVIGSELMTYNTMSAANSPNESPEDSPKAGTQPKNDTTICFLADVVEVEVSQGTAAVAAALAAVCSVVAWLPPHHAERHQLLQDTLLEMATWSYPEAGGEYVFPFLRDEIKWHAPKFFVTSKPALLNFSSRDVIDPKHTRRAATDLRQRMQPIAMPHPANGLLLDRLSGTRYIFGEVSLFSIFRSCLRKLWQLWELGIAAEPLCIISQSPTVSSSATLAMTSLIHPITSCIDFRPYFSVQDQDFKHFARLGQRDGPRCRKGPIIGVTNPYFLKVLKSWPHVLTLNDHTVPGGAEAKQQREKELRKKLNKSVARGKSSRERLLSEFRETFLSERQFVVNCSTEAVKPILDQLLVGSDATTDHVNTNVLRKHFLHLTDQFLKPVHACFSETWQNIEVPFVMQLTECKRLFARRVFKEHVRKNGYEKSLFKKDAKLVHQFYDDFFDGCHFETWIEEQLLERYKIELVSPKLADFIRTCGEGQRIEVLMALCQTLTAEEKKVVRDTNFITALQKQIDTILASLPENLRKPLLRRHYRNSLGEEAVLPQALLSDEGFDDAESEVGDVVQSISPASNLVPGAGTEVQSSGSSHTTSHVDTNDISSPCSDRGPAKSGDEGSSDVPASGAADLRLSISSEDGPRSRPVACNCARESSGNALGSAATTVLQPT